MRPKPKEKTEWEKLEHLVVGRLTVLKKQDRQILKDIRSDTGESLLHVACRTLFFENVEYLVNEVGCDVNLADNYGVIPLDCALRSGEEKENYKIVELLLKKVKLLACQRIFEDPEISKKLGRVLTELKDGPEKAASYLRRRGWTVDQVAHLQDDQLTTHFLLKSPEYPQYKKLIKLVFSNDLASIKQSLRHVSHSKRITSWALLNATAKTQPESPLIVKLLLDFGAPVDGFLGDSATPLNNALASLNVESSQVLFERGARVVSKGIFNNLREKMRASPSPAVESCLRLIFEYRGLWAEGQARNFKDIFWLSQFFNVNFPILKLVFEYLSRERQPLGPQDDFLPPNYYLKCFEYWNCSSKLVLKMKACKLKGVPVTLYDLLVKSTDELVVYTRNEGLMAQIEDLKLVNKFFVHGRTLKNKLEKAREKRLLIDESVKVLRTCLPHTGSDGLVLNKIVGYLGVPNFLCSQKDVTK